MSTMGLLAKIWGNHSSEDQLKQEISKKGFEVSTCSEQCDDCHSKYPSSLKFDDDFPLWNSTKPFGLHLVVATGKTDWPHDATGTSGTLSHAVAHWASKAKFEELSEESSLIKVTVGSLSSDALITNEEYINEAAGDVLILPFFAWVRNVRIKQVPQVFDTVIAELIQLRKTHSSELPTKSYPEFPDVKVECDPNQAHVFLCSHRTRDKRCGVTAPIIKKEMDIYLRDLGLYRDHGDNRPGGVNISFINHIGGHKYAANIIIYLRKSGKNIWLARCKPNNCRPIIDECILSNGKVWPDKVRIIQKFDPIDW